MEIPFLEMLQDLHVILSIYLLSGSGNLTHAIILAWFARLIQKRRQTSTTHLRLPAAHPQIPFPLSLTLLGLTDLLIGLDDI